MLSPYEDLLSETLRQSVECVLFMQLFYQSHCFIGFARVSRSSLGSVACVISIVRVFIRNPRAIGGMCTLYGGFSPKALFHWLFMTCSVTLRIGGVCYLFMRGFYPKPSQHPNATQVNPLISLGSLRVRSIAPLVLERWCCRSERGHIGGMGERAAPHRYIPPQIFGTKLGGFPS